MKQRPAESISSLIGLLVAAALGIDGQEFPALVAAALGQIAAVVTYVVERRRQPGYIDQLDARRGADRAWADDPGAVARAQEERRRIERRGSSADD